MKLHPPLRLTSLLLACLLSAPLPVMAQEYNLDMRNTDISEFIATVGKLTDKTFIVDNRVKGKINLTTPKALTADELYDIFLMQLGINGFSVVDMGSGLLKIIPSQSAKLEGGPVLPDGSRNQPPGEAVITRVVQVKNVEVTKLVPILRPLVDNKIGVIAPYAESNVLLITDRASNVRRLVEIIDRVDKADSDTLEIVNLQNASAKETANVLSTLIKEHVKGREGVVGAPSIVADDRTNSLLIRGDATSRAYLKQVIEQLDNEIPTASNTRVYYLKYAKAKDLVPVLASVSDSILKEERGGNGQPAPGPRARNINIEAHEQTNTIVLSGSPQLIKNLEGIIKQLDIRRAQVMVEAIIVELSEARAKELGMQWLFAGDFNGSAEPIGFVNFGNSNSGILNIGSAAAADSSDALSQSLSAIQGVALGVGRINDDAFSFVGLLNALAEDSDSNILSTPSLMTMDNEEASILVGQEVPVVTGSTASSNNANPFQTITRQDVGVKLKVIPQINEGDAVQLDIEQEVSSLTGLSASDIITNKREIKTSVLVDDGATIVLGGLIDDDIQESTAKVPGLGDIPLLGRAFRSDLTRKTKRNLMVFIRPTIIRDKRTLSALSHRKYSYIQAEQLMMSENGINLFPEVKAPVLPEWGAFGPSPENLLNRSGAAARNAAGAAKEAADER